MCLYFLLFNDFKDICDYNVGLKYVDLFVCYDIWGSLEIDFFLGKGYIRKLFIIIIKFDVY